MSFPTELQVTARTGHLRSYEDPIAVQKGDPVELTGQTDDWDGHIWVWAVAKDGREGWDRKSVV